MHKQTLLLSCSSFYPTIHFLKQHFPQQANFFSRGSTIEYKHTVHHTHTQPRTHLSIAHKCGVLSHQYVGSEEEDEGVTEAQQGPVQERPERQQRVLADVPVGNTQNFLVDMLYQSTLSCLTVMNKLIVGPLPSDSEKTVS